MTRDAHAKKALDCRQFKRAALRQGDTIDAAIWALEEDMHFAIVEGDVSRRLRESVRPGSGS